MTETTLKQIIEGCKRGDTKSQSALYHHFASRMLSVCRRYAADKQEAEDVLQEAFIKIFKHLGSYSGTGSFEAWVRSIVNHTAISTYRKNKVRNFHISRHQTLYADMHTTLVVGTDTTYLHNAIAALPHHHRISFNLFAIEGYSYKEIAEQTGFNLVQSRVNVFRARQALKQRIAL